MLAVSRHEQGRFEQPFNRQDHDEDEENHTLCYFARMSAGLHTLSIILSTHSRGPYNQWQKCTEFFEISIGKTSQSIQTL